MSRLRPGVYAPLACPHCKNKEEMFYLGRCPACMSTGAFYAVPERKDPDMTSYCPDCGKQLLSSAPCSCKMVLAYPCECGGLRRLEDTACHACIRALNPPMPQGSMQTVLINRLYSLLESEHRSFVSYIIAGIVDYVKVKSGLHGYKGQWVGTEHAEKAYAETVPTFEAFIQIPDMPPAKEGWKWVQIPVKEDPWHGEPPSDT